MMQSDVFVYVRIILVFLTSDVDNFLAMIKIKIIFFSCLEIYVSISCNNPTEHM